MALYRPHGPHRPPDSDDSPLIYDAPVVADDSDDGAPSITSVSHLATPRPKRRKRTPWQPGVQATGTFRDDFAGRSAALIDVVKRTRSTSVGTVTEAGLESLSGNEGRVLVSIAVTTDTFGIAEKQPRYWRMRLTLVRDEDSAKVSKLDFVS